MALGTRLDSVVVALITAVDATDFGLRFRSVITDYYNPQLDGDKSFDGDG